MIGGTLVFGRRLRHEAYPPCTGDAPPWKEKRTCPECGGLGKIPLFTSLSSCQFCLGFGGWLVPRVGGLLETLRTPEGRRTYLEAQERFHKSLGPSREDHPVRGYRKAAENRSGRRHMRVAKRL